MDPEIALRFRGYLMPHETIRWTGRPVQGFAFQHGDLVTVPMGAVWLVFMAVWFNGIASGGAWLSYAFLGSIFAFVGFDFVFGRYIKDAYVRSKTYYALSDERALILSGWSGKNLTSVEIAAVPEINIIPGGDRGTIVFGPTNDTSVLWNRRSERAPSPEFFKIEQSQSVYALIQARRRIQ